MMPKKVSGTFLSVMRTVTQLLSNSLYGLYTLHQTSGWEGYEFVDDFSVQISENEKTYPFIINNAIFTAKIEIVKKMLKAAISFLLPEWDLKSATLYRGMDKPELRLSHPNHNRYFLYQ